MAILIMSKNIILHCSFKLFPSLRVCTVYLHVELYMSTRVRLCAGTCVRVCACACVCVCVGGGGESHG